MSETQTRLGQEVIKAYVEEGAQYPRMEQGKIHLILKARNRGRYCLVINMESIRTDWFEYVEGEASEDEREAMDNILRVINTGWYFFKGTNNFQCVYCGATAEGPRVTSFPCPCRGEHTD